MKVISLYFFLFLITLTSNLTYAAVAEDQMKLLEQLPPDQRASILQKMESASSLQEEIEETFEGASSLIEKPEREDLKKGEDYCSECIYGFNFFQYSPSTFSPVNDTPVSSGYILGPGDVVVVNYFGSNTDEVIATVNREGVVILPLLGPINFLGKTFQEAGNLLTKKVQKELIGTDVILSIREVRSIGVYILGENYKPGRYVMSGLSTVSNALFVSGGVNEKGSLRNIQVIRNNQIIANYDFYDFLLKGSINSDITLQDGDVIFVPFIENSVILGGAFKRPFRYEFLEGETLKDAINLAGGFVSDVLNDPKIELSSVDRLASKRNITYLNYSTDLDREIRDGDVINTSSIAGLSPQSISLTGEIMKPGEYSIQPGETILDIINRAGGYTEQAYFQGAVFLREAVAVSQKKAFSRSADQLENTIVDVITKNSIDQVTEFTLSPISVLIKRLRNEDPLGRMVVNLDLLDLKTNPITNFTLEDGDSLFIPKRQDFVSIVGEVLNGTTVNFDPNLTVDQYIQLSGGLNDSADKDKIFIILPNGRSQLVRRSLFTSTNQILPGSTIVISRDSRPFDAINLTQIITPILADLATSAAAIAAISNN
ncbi:SLBB domain-containing protein [Gammaproteobacteria bacterium]|nr:SLBB domain-containing protein [Gammaproteobacteria bacterium]